MFRYTFGRHPLTTSRGLTVINEYSYHTVTTLLEVVTAGPWNQPRRSRAAIHPSTIVVLLELGR